MEYLSVSQYNSFVGTPFKKRCEARTMAKLKGEWKDEPSPAMLIGSYADAYFEGTLDDFRAEHPEIYTQKGELRADFSKALEIIRFVEQDDFCLRPWRQQQPARRHYADGQRGFHLPPPASLTLTEPPLRWIR